MVKTKRYISPLVLVLTKRVMSTAGERLAIAKERFRNAPITDPDTTLPIAGPDPVAQEAALARRATFGSFGLLRHLPGAERGPRPLGVGSRAWAAAVNNAGRRGLEHHLSSIVRNESVAAAETPSFWEVHALPSGHTSSVKIVADPGEIPPSHEVACTEEQATLLATIREQRVEVNRLTKALVKRHEKDCHLFIDLFAIPRGTRLSGETSAGKGAATAHPDPVTLEDDLEILMSLVNDPDAVLPPPPSSSALRHLAREDAARFREDKEKATTEDAISDLTAANRAHAATFLAQRMETFRRRDGGEKPHLGPAAVSPQSLLQEIECQVLLSYIADAAERLPHDTSSCSDHATDISKASRAAAAAAAAAGPPSALHSRHTDPSLTGKSGSDSAFSARVAPAAPGDVSGGTGAPARTPSTHRTSTSTDGEAVRSSVRFDESKAPGTSMRPSDSDTRSGIAGGASAQPPIDETSAIARSPPAPTPSAQLRNVTKEKPKDDVMCGCFGR